MPIDVSGFAAGWTFLGRAALSTLNSAWSAASPLPSATVYALLQEAASSIEQAFTTTVAGTHTIRFYAQTNWWPTGTQRFNVLVDGTPAYSTGAINPFAWTQRTFTVAIPTIGVHTLKFVGTTAAANETGYLDSVTITGPDSNPAAFVNGNANFDGFTLGPGQIVYNPPATATPTLRLVASVTTCGKWLECRLTRISDGFTVAPTAINEAPIVGVNGVAAGPLQVPIGAPGFPILATASHGSWLAPVPTSVIGAGLAAGDVVTLSASEGWIFGPSRYAEAMTAQAVPNRVGRSFKRLADVPRTMALGASYAHHVTAEWHPGFLPKNQRYRCAYWVPNVVSQDSAGNPLVMGAAISVAPVVNVSASSNIDATSYPTPAGYWAVRWDDLDGGTSFSLTDAGDPDTSVAEVTSLANPGVGGIGKVKVYDFQATGPAVNLQVWLQLNKADKNPHFDNLAILAPGDFAWTANTPTVIPMPTWDEVAGVIDAKLPPSLPFGPHRLPTAGIILGESAAHRREHVVDPDDFHWAQDPKTRNQIRYIQARPWTNAASPYIYDPLGGANYVDYAATLGADILTVPAAGTIETITITDATTAPVLSDLVLTAGSEKMLVMTTPTTTAVRVMRGVASTTPAAHAAGPISVSARRLINNLAEFGPSNQQVTELVTQSAHGLKTGQIVPFEGDGWKPFIYSDGRGFVGTWFNPYHMPVYVTGASTLLTIQNGPAPSNPTNTTLSTTYTLTPGPAAHECSSLLYLPEYGGVPYEVAATAAARHPGAPARVTFCMVASDDMVDAIWRDRILPYLPAGRDVYVEVGDEPWNFAGAPASYWYGESYRRYGINSPYYWYAVLVGKIRDRGRAIWTDAGRDPLHVKSTINVQTGASGALGPLLTFLAARSAVPDLVEIAPYYDIFTDVSFYKAWAAWSTDMLVDAWIWDFYENSSVGSSNWGGGQVHRTGDFKLAIDAWNAAHSGSVALGIYEYGPGLPWPIYSAPIGATMDATTTTLTLSNATAYPVHDDRPDDCAKIQPGSWLKVNSEWMTVSGPKSGVSVPVIRGQGGTTAASHLVGTNVSNDWIAGVRDLTLHPNFRIAHLDVLWRFQELGVSMCIPSSLDQEWSGGNAWSDYHAIGQRPGMGDGTGGGLDNRLCLARRGQANSKAATASQDANTDSVRGQAMIDFLTPPPPTGGVHMVRRGASRGPRKLGFIR